jgi:hypothetical protein
MSQEDVDVVRSGFEAWSASEPDFSNFHPALVYHPRGDVLTRARTLAALLSNGLFSDSWKRFRTCLSKYGS